MRSIKSERTTGIRISDVTVEYHRNGICGEGFHYVRFTATASDLTAEKLIAVVFDEPGHCAVLNVEAVFAGKADQGYRGDYFEKQLRLIIAEWRKERG
jgi:hypothetical protein